MAISKFDLLCDLVTQLFDLRPKKNYMILCCGRLHIGTKFGDD